MNKEVRDYQVSISKNCLLHNTLVVLPTGMGKTLIAAVVTKGSIVVVIN